MTECNTQYIFEGSAHEIAELYEKIVQKKESNELSVLIDALGCGDDGMDCCGHISHFEMAKPTAIKLEVITKHRENVTPFASIMHLFPSLQCYFSAHNPEVGYYGSNDYARVHFPERYIINYSGEEPIFCNNIHKLYSEMSLILGEMVGSLDDVVERIAEHNKTYGNEEQIGVSEVLMADDLVNHKVKTIVQRMETLAANNKAVQGSSSLYRDMRFVAKAKGEMEFVWVILPSETRLYKWDSAFDLQLLLSNMEHWQEMNIDFQMHHHRNILALLPRSAKVIKSEILTRLKTYTDGE